MYKKVQSFEVFKSTTGKLQYIHLGDYTVWVTTAIGTHQQYIKNGLKYQFCLKKLFT